MSLDTYIVCREPLPARAGGWNLTVGPVRISEVKWDEHPELEGQAGFHGVQLLNLSYRAISGEAGDEMARILAEVGRGIVIYESGTDDREDFEPSTHRTLTATVLEADLNAIVKDAEHRERQVTEQSKREFDAEQKQDPVNVARANDWSEL